MKKLSLMLLLASAPLLGMAQEPPLIYKKSIRGLVVTPRGQPSFSSDSLSFSGVTVGQRLAPKVVQLTNVGEEPLLVKRAYIYGGDGYNGFFLDSNTCEGDLAPQSTCSMAVSAVVPSGSRLAQLTVELGNSMERISRLQLLSVQEPEPPVTLKAVASMQAPTAFPGTAPGFTSQQVLQLQNIGNAPLQVEALSVRTTQFEVAHACTQILPGQACPVTVKFKPTSVGAKADTLTLKTSADETASSFSLSGTTVIGGLALSATYLSYGDLAMGSSAEKVLTVTNSGTGPTTVDFSGLSAPFTLNNTCPAVLDPKAQCSVTVRFAPTAPVSASQTLVIKGSTGVSQRSVSVNGGATLNLTVASNTYNYDVGAQYTQRYGAPTGPVRVTVTINSSVVVSQVSTAPAAFTTGALPAGSEVTLVNKGLIIGQGGRGGHGSSSGNQGGTGGAGGDAVLMTVTTKIDNSGYILGGGGGGGGSPGVKYVVSGTGGGGGGGAGAGGGAGGNYACGSLGCGKQGGNTSVVPYPTAGGAYGGSGYSNSNGVGGKGGGYGEAGQDSTAGSTNWQIGKGGPAGKAVRTNGNSLVWLNQGQIKGAAN